MPEDEEIEHDRETIRRWEAGHGGPIRAGIDRLLKEFEGVRSTRSIGADRSSRLGPIDEFHAIEKRDLIERRSKARRDRTDAILARYRDTHPSVVRRFEAAVRSVTAPSAQGREAY